MSQVRSWLPKVLGESLLIVFSILLALAVDEWREERQTAKRVAQTLESFALEIQENQRYLAGLAPYHEGLKKEFGRMREAGGFPSIKSLGEIKGFRGFNPPTPKDGAWRTALGIGALAELDFETASLLSSIYTSQEQLVEMGGTLRLIFQPQNFLDANIPATNMIVYEYLNDLAINERDLLKGYRTALRHLEEKKAAVGP